MQHKCFAKAKRSLELAEKFYEKFIDTFDKDEFEENWSAFLVQSHRFYNSLSAGAKSNSKIHPWYGRLVHQRKKDPLLSYIHHARNADEHGLNIVVTGVGSNLEVTQSDGAKEVHVSFEMKVDHRGQVHIRNFNSNTPEAIKKAILHNYRFELEPVIDTGVTYHPPLIHLDRPIVDCSPAGVARLAILYFHDTLRSASKLG